VDLVGYPNGEPSGAPAEIFYCLSNEMHGYTLLANINNISIIDIFLKKTSWQAAKRANPSKQAVFDNCHR